MEGVLEPKFNDEPETGESQYTESQDVSRKRSKILVFDPTDTGDLLEDTDILEDTQSDENTLHPLKIQKSGK